VRAETSDVAFRLLLALGELWDGLQRANIDATRKGLHLSKQYLGGYVRISVGPGSRPRLTFEWNEATRHLRVLRCEAWPGLEATLSATVAYVREQARARGIADVVDGVLLRACREPLRAKVTLAARDGTRALTPQRA
jgi:hypothetical protein